VASSSSSSEPELAPRHRDADARLRARLNELAEARRQLDEELANLHQELGMDTGPRDGRPTQDVPVQSATIPAGVPEPRRCSHVAARLPRACDLRGATSAPTAEGATRGCGSTTSGQLRLAPTLGARAGQSTIRPRPESASFPSLRARGGSQSRDIGGQESSWAQPRRSEHHRDLMTGRECRQQPRQPLAPPRRPWARTAPRQRRRPRP
jgi:hypothetical protein